jgi:hypothetical protein
VGASDADFSSVERNVFVVHGDRVDWKPLAGVVDRILEYSGDIAFVIYRPWWPGLTRKIGAFHHVFGDTIDEGAQVSIAPMTSGLVNRTLSLRDELGGDGAGLWVIGACDDKKRLRSSFTDWSLGGDPPIFLAAGLMQTATAALALDEGAISALFVSLDKPVFGAISDLVDAFGDTPYYLAREEL